MYNNHSKKSEIDFSHYNQENSNFYAVWFGFWSAVERSPCPVESLLGSVLWKNNRVDLAVVIHEVDLQAFGDVICQVREVLPVFSWQDNASHTSTPRLKRTRESSANKYCHYLKQIYFC